MGEKRDSAEEHPYVLESHGKQIERLRGNDSWSESKERAQDQEDNN